MIYLFVPGGGGSEAEHWQSVWEDDLGDRATRIQPASWTHPEPADWHRALSEAASSECVVVAHSLGCLASAAWLSDAPRPRVRGALLVAAPDPASPAFPAECAAFRAPRGPLGVPTLMISSTDDPYSTIGWSRAIAGAWGASIVELDAVGHINAAAGVGGWGEGRRLLATFVAGLG